MKDLQIVESLNEIIRTQSKVIDELYKLLLQHITVEEFNGLEICDMLKDVRSNPLTKRGDTFD